MESASHPSGHRGSAARWAFWGFALVAGYFLLTEHRAHMVAFLPYLLLAACPLMHFFHHGHGHHRSDAGENRLERPGRDGSHPDLARPQDN